jgi:hypothetical protein
LFPTRTGTLRRLCYSGLWLGWTLPTFPRNLGAGK